MQIINGVKCRSGRESLAHIIAQAKKGKIGPSAEKDESNWSCEYKYDSGNTCAVGSLFSKAQLKDIHKRMHNGSAIAYVAKDVGQDNLQTVTGLKLNQLIALQKAHDSAPANDRIANVVKVCEEALQTGTLSGSPIFP